MAGRKNTSALIIKNFINFMRCDKHEIYFQPHVILKQGNIIILSRFKSGLNCSLFLWEQSIL